MSNPAALTALPDKLGSDYPVARVMGTVVCVRRASCLRPRGPCLGTRRILFIDLAQVRLGMGERTLALLGAMMNGLPGIRVVEVTESTNDDAMHLGRAGAPHGSTVVARRQTLGRGRRGHVWVSPAGGLYLSVLVRPQVPREALAAISVATALGAFDACLSLGASGVALKWPNDLVVPVGAENPFGAKLAGILVEVGEGPEGAFAVCGIGVNLVRGDRGAICPPAVRDGMAAPLPPAYLEDLLPEAARHRLRDGLCATATVFRDAMVSRVDAWACALGQEPSCAGPLSPLLPDYLSHLAARGRSVLAVSADGTPICQGTLVSVDAFGKAHVIGGDGHVTVLSSELCSLRPAVPGA